MGNRTTFVGHFYGVSKAALDHYARYAGLLYGPLGVRINSLRYFVYRVVDLFTFLQSWYDQNSVVWTCRQTNNNWSFYRTMHEELCIETNGWAFRDRWVHFVHGTFSSKHPIRLTHASLLGLRTIILYERFCFGYRRRTVGQCNSRAGRFDGTNRVYRISIPRNSFSISLLLKVEVICHYYGSIQAFDTLYN